MTECFRLSPRFDEAVERLMARTPFSTATMAWQLRVEKMALPFHKHGATWYREFRRNLLKQAELVGAASRACATPGGAQKRRGGALLFESDLLGGSTTMWDTLFRRHVKAGLQPMQMYGVPEINETTIESLRAELLSSVLHRLRSGGVRASRSRGLRATAAGGRLNEVLTSNELLNLTSRPTDGPLSPFLASPMGEPGEVRPPLRLERALLSVAILSKAGTLVRSPMSSTFSGWANAIRIAANGRGAAAWVTEDGARWWRCERSRGIKLGKCTKELQSEILPSPKLCSSTTASPGRRMGAVGGGGGGVPPYLAPLVMASVFEVAAPPIPRPPPDANATAWVLSSLVKEELRPVSTSAVHTAAERPVPLETRATAEQLAWEHQETLAFERKQLKADPRLKPSDIRVTFDHLSECTECRAQEEVRKAVHGEHADPINISEWQLLVDDYVIGTWRNVLRFVNDPKDEQVVMSPPSNASSSARFGCPCSAVRLPGGSHKLLHTAGAVTGPGHRYREWPSAINSLVSSDGRGNWRRPRKITLDGFWSGVTGSFTIASQSSGDRDGSSGQQQAPLVAGYEGANSKACLARSLDGRHWQTVPTAKRLPIQPTVSRKPSEANADEMARGRPWHLTKSLIKINLRRHPFNILCRSEIQRCMRSGASWGGGLVMQCVILSAHNGTISKMCSRALEPKMRPLLSDCVDGTRSALGRAGDCNVQPIFDARRRRQLVWYRQDFGTPGGWREIRGVQVIELNETLDRVAGVVEPVRRVGSYYLDRLGKLERYRRQVYSVTLTRHSDSLWLGLMTVIEWAKDLSEPTGASLPAFQRDTTNIYLVTSRDGVHIDPGWVYARRPLVRKGATQADWNAGFVLAANEVLSEADLGESRVYYEARHLRHEERFNRPGVIGLAAWHLHALVGLRAADAASGAGVIVTKPFALPAPGGNGGLTVLLNLDTTLGSSGSVLVELLDEERKPLLGASGEASVPITDRAGSAVAAQWRHPLGDGPSSSAAEGQPAKAASTAVIRLVGYTGKLRLKMTLNGAARLYAFRVKAG